MPPVLTEPGFVGTTLKNVTVPEGRDVVLSCTVKNLDGHKVSEMKVFFKKKSPHQYQLILGVTKEGRGREDTNKEGF